MPILRMTDGEWNKNQTFFTPKNPATWLNDLLQKPRWKKAKVFIHNYQYSGHFATIKLGYKTFDCYNESY